VLLFEWIQKHVRYSTEVSEQSDDNGIDPTKSFSQLGGDSLSAMHLSSLLREHLSLDLAVDVILKTPLANIMSDICGGRGVCVHYDWTEEASLDSAGLDTSSQRSLSEVPEMSSSLLLTGCTGFLGRFILWELLQNTKIARIFCLAQNREGTMNYQYIPALQYSHCGMRINHYY
jgi:acyl carrier protein